METGHAAEGYFDSEFWAIFAFRRPLESANLLLFSSCCRLSKLLNFQSNTDSGDTPGSHLGLRSRLDLAPKRLESRQSHHLMT